MCHSAKEWYTDMMPIVLNNIPWMSFNVFLALLPLLSLLFVYFSRSVKNPILKFLLGSLWIAFLPNTIYLLLDLIHLPGDLLHTSAAERIVVLLMYSFLVILGLVTYFFAFQPLESLFPRKISKQRTWRLSLLILCNIIIGFALVLGRVLRVNSWDILLNPRFVIDSSLQIIMSTELIVLCVLFSLMSTFCYLGFKKLFIQSAPLFSNK